MPRSSADIILSTITIPAPSPRLSPFLLRANGRQGSCEVMRSEVKPRYVVRHNSSAPPAITISQVSFSIQDLANPMASVPDEQALAMVTAGPRQLYNPAMERAGLLERNLFTG